MFVLILTVYEFVSATGSWSTHSGFGAFMFGILFCLTVGWSLVLAFMAPSWYTWGFSKLIQIGFGNVAGKIVLNVCDIIDIIVTGFYVGPFVVAPISLALYFFFDFGEFAHGGWLMSSSRSINWFDWFALAYIAFSNYSYYDRFNIKFKNQNDEND